MLRRKLMFILCIFSPNCATLVMSRTILAWVSTGFRHILPTISNDLTIKQYSSRFQFRRKTLLKSVYSITVISYSGLFCLILLFGHSVTVRVRVWVRSFVSVEAKLSFVEPGRRWAHSPSPSKAPGISYQGTMKTSVRMSQTSEGLELLYAVNGRRAPSLKSRRFTSF